MQDLIDFCERGLAMDEDSLLETVFNDVEFQKEVIEQNQSQLYDEGIEADGTTLGNYAPRTIMYKENIAPGLGYDTKTDHVTLKDTGYMYSTMKVNPQEDGFVVNADMRKPNVDLEVVYPDALGLTDESIEKILPRVQEILVENIFEQLTA